MKILNHFLAFLFVTNLFSQSLSFENQTNTSQSSRYRLATVQDPRTTMNIGFDANFPHANPILYYSTTDHGQDYTKYENSFTTEELEFIRFKNKGTEMNSAFAKLSGLSADTAYFFVIKDDLGVSKRYWFKTAPADNRQMAFISGGDTRSGGTKRKNGNRMVAVLKPVAVLFGGDYNDAKNSDGQWKGWLNDWELSIAEDGRMFPIIPVRGNHDSTASLNKVFGTGLDYNYKITFGKDLFSVFTLDTEIGYPDSQVEWFENAARDCNSIWKATQYHKPMRPHFSGKSEGESGFQKWFPIMERYGFDISFESDTHMLKRTWPVVSCENEGEIGANGNVCELGLRRDDENGIIFVGEGSWGVGTRNADDAKVWTRDMAEITQLKWVCISETEMTEHTILHNNTNFNNVVPNDNSGTCAIPENVAIWNPANGDIVQLQKSVLSTKKYNRNNVLAINPNPTKGIVNIKGAKEGGTVRVTALDGAHVSTKDIVNQKIDIQNLNSGVYILNIFDANNQLISVNKVIKE